MAGYTLRDKLRNEDVRDKYKVYNEVGKATVLPK